MVREYGITRARLHSAQILRCGARDVEKVAWMPANPAVMVFVTMPQAVSSNCTPAVKAALLIVSKAPMPFPAGIL